MPDQPPANPPAADRIDRAVLALLLAEGVPLSLGELAREVGDPLAAADAASRLQRAGLAHRCGDLLVPSRAARRFDQLAV